DLQRVIVCHPVGDDGFQVAWVALLAVPAQVSELQRGAAWTGKGAGRPDHLVEAAQPAVQVVLAVVPRQRVRPSAEREAAPGDPIRVPPDDCPEIEARPEVAVQVVVPEYHVVQAPAAIGHAERNDGRAVGRDPGRGRPRGIPERIELDGSAVLGRSERRPLDPGRGPCARGRSPAAAQRMPLSMSGTSAPMVLGVTTPAPVLVLRPAKPYFFDSTHCATGRKPCR